MAFGEAMHTMLPAQNGRMVEKTINENDVHHTDDWSPATPC